jgi:hypothetical protein
MAKQTWLKGAALVVIAALALAGCNKAQAQAGGSSGGGTAKASNIKEAPASDFGYGLTDDKKGVSITKYTGKGGKVAIPAIIEDMPVTEIGNAAFRWNTEITEIVIPARVTKIGASAFEGCSSLTTVGISASLEEIGYYAFGDCGELNNLIIPDSISSIKFPHDSKKQEYSSDAFIRCGKLPLAARSQIEAWGYKGKF